MKLTYLLILIFLVFGYSANAQFTKNNSLYLGTGFSVGNFDGADFNLNYSYQQKWSAQFGVKSASREAENIPPDYSGGFFNAITLGLSNPKDEITSYQFLGGKMVLLSESKVSTRLNLLTGPTFNQFGRSVNFQRSNENGFFGASYTFEKEQSSGFGWMVKPAFEFTFGKIFGLGINPYLHFNSFNFSYGLEFQLLIGILQPSR